MSALEKPSLEKYKDLFEKKAFANLSTLMPDGSPQVTPVWVDYDGTHILVNSAKGRVKDKNMRRDARVAVAISDPENPYRYIEVRGKVVEITESGADDHINRMPRNTWTKMCIPSGPPTKCG
jgi:PPOX class probable F420-dependent enzyme